MDSDRMRQIGRKGGLSHKQRDPDYFRKLGRRGGLATGAKIAADPDFKERWLARGLEGRNFVEPDFQAMGRLGGEAHRRRMEDPDYREQHIRRSRMGKEFGVELP